MDDISEIGPYHLLPFTWKNKSEGRVFLTTEVGDFMTISKKDFCSFVDKSILRTSRVFADLVGKGFASEPSGLNHALELQATRLRTRNRLIDQLGGLHIMVVTLRCNQSCGYCQVSRVSEDKDAFDMSRENALKALDIIFSSPAKLMKIEFQGGESLLNFDLIRYVVKVATARALEEDRRVDFVIATNLMPATSEILEFCKMHDIVISTSIDGPKDLHNKNRPSGVKDTFSVVEDKIALARNVLGHDGVSALMTTSNESLSKPVEIIDEYLRLGFDEIFLRPVSPYGFAARGKKKFLTEESDFFDFYKKGLEYIIDLNRKGTRIMESWTQILLERMYDCTEGQYVDLSSPSGSGISGMCYNYDGNIYPADEGRMLQEMNDQSFLLGTVDDEYHDLFKSQGFQYVMAGGVNQSLPGCSSCAYRPFCGAEPVRNYVLQNDPVGIRPTSSACSNHIRTFDLITDFLESGDDFVRDLFESWAFMRRSTPL